MKKTLIILFMGICLFTFVEADTSSFTMKFIVPSDAPTFDDLRNMTGYANTSFSEDLDASDPDGIDCFWLNQTNVFDIDCAGTITNVTQLTNISIYWLEVTVNDTIGYNTTGKFYIDIRELFNPLRIVWIEPDTEGIVPHVILGRRMTFQ